MKKSYLAWLLPIGSIYLASCQPTLPPPTGPLPKGYCLYQVPYVQNQTEGSIEGGVAATGPSAGLKLDGKNTSGYIPFFGKCNDMKQVQLPGGGTEAKSDVKDSSNKTAAAVTAAAKKAVKDPSKKLEVSILLNNTARYYKALAQYEPLEPAKGSTVQIQDAIAALESASESYAKAAGMEQGKTQSNLLDSNVTFKFTRKLNLHPKPIASNKASLLKASNDLRTQATKVAGK